MIEDKKVESNLRSNIHTNTHLNSHSNTKKNSKVEVTKNKVKEVKENAPLQPYGGGTARPSATPTQSPVGPTASPSYFAGYVPPKATFKPTA